MEDLRRLCVRMLGEGPAANAAIDRAVRDLPGARDEDPVARRTGEIRAVLSACHDLVPAGEGIVASPSADGPDDLAANVDRELAAASAGCSERQRALLALRDLVGLAYAEIAEVLGADTDTVASGLAGARIALRERLRGPGAPAAPCPEAERALRTMTRRLDREPVPAADADWIIDHLGLCESCGRNHAAMLEAAACYRAWS